ncbi:DUF2637 domain-containing protein [Streptomyces sp. ITFR-6]|uniref:DUF2637 domain-containing protein n=1 Tax=Streptomyces sp. ITFR-6 TaxID=3075197 RepID=UPI00288BBFC4|nr:DUF2637 domain-containing protein [Streptomyces sp. ITFR-6]WNI28599.1 DUF2637 domain-containing protein [Streptomyces sp. ITFR-6]
MRAKLGRIDPILIQATIAAALSFAHIHDIAAAAGQDGWKAWAYPISVDLLMVMAWRRMRTGEERRDKGMAWFWFLLSLATSLGANVGTSGVLDLSALPTWLRILVAGWPAVAFLGGSLLVHDAKPAEVTEAPTEGPQEAVGAPDEEPEPQHPEEPVKEPEKPLLRTYAEVADVLNVAPETVRGWKAQGKIISYPGQGANNVLVDLRECQSVKSRRSVSV